MAATPVVLLIEDQTELGNVLRDVMTAEGYEVLAVRDQSAAVATLRNQPVDLIVVDLPDAKSEASDPLVEIVRNYPETPLVVIRHESSEEIPFFGPWRASAGRITLRRPFKLDDLLSVARDVVG